MTKMKIWACAALLLVCVLPVHGQQSPSSISANSASAVVPRLVKFGGTLLDDQGHALKGPVGVTFALFARQSGGAALWLETQNVKPGPSGNYTVLLGASSANGIPEELFASGEARWLGIQAEGQPEQPRVLLVSVPYALKAGDAQTLDGRPASDFALAGTTAASASPGSASAAVAGTTVMVASGQAQAPLATTIGGGGTPTDIPIWTGSATLGNSVMSQAGGNVSVAGGLQLPAKGTANSTTKGFNSQPFDLLTSVFNGTAPVNVHFRWQAEPVNPGLGTASGKLNLLFASGTGAPAETGLSVSNKGLITFAPGQTLPSGITGQTASFTGNNLTQIVSVTQNGGGIGVSGTATAHNGVGVFGSNTAANNGIGVEGVGVTGLSGTGLTSVAGSGGVFGTSLAVGGKGVSGVGGGTAGTGVTGLGTTGVSGTGFSTVSGSIGVAGSTAASRGTGVSGAASGGSGTGVIGTATGTSGIGVNGSAPATGTGVFGSSGGGLPFVPAGAGVVGETAATNGVGVSGVALNGGTGVKGTGPTAGSFSGTGTGSTFTVVARAPDQLGLMVQGPAAGVGAGLDLQTTGTGSQQWELLSTGQKAAQGAGKLNFRDLAHTADLLTLDSNTDQVGVNNTAPIEMLDVEGRVRSTNLVKTVTANDLVSPDKQFPTFDTMPGMTMTITTGNVPVLIIGQVGGIRMTDCSVENIDLLVDRASVYHQGVQSGDTNGGNPERVSATLVSIQSLAPGSHTIEIGWAFDVSECGGAFTSLVASDFSSTRSLTVIELAGQEQ